MNAKVDGCDSDCAKGDVGNSSVQWQMKQTLRQRADEILGKSVTAKNALLLCQMCRGAREKIQLRLDIPALTRSFLL